MPQMRKVEPLKHVGLRESSTEIQRLVDLEYVKVQPLLERFCRDLVSARSTHIFCKFSKN